MVCASVCISLPFSSEFARLFYKTLFIAAPTTTANAFVSIAAMRCRCVGTIVCVLVRVFALGMDCMCECVFEYVTYSHIYRTVCCGGSLWSQRAISRILTLACKWNEDPHSHSSLTQIRTTTKNHTKSYIHTHTLIHRTFPSTKPDSQPLRTSTTQIFWKSLPKPSMSTAHHTLQHINPLTHILYTYNI